MHRSHSHSRRWATSSWLPMVVTTSLLLLGWKVSDAAVNNHHHYDAGPSFGRGGQRWNHQLRNTTTLNSHGSSSPARELASRIKGGSTTRVRKYDPRGQYYQGMVRRVTLQQLRPTTTKTTASLTRTRSGVTTMDPHRRRNSWRTSSSPLVSSSPQPPPPTILEELMASSTPPATTSREEPITSNVVKQQQHQPTSPKVQKLPPLTKVDLAIPMIFFCSAVAFTFPVILIPLIGESHTTSSNAVTSFVGKVASISIMGGGIGKIVNGIVCQRWGGSTTGSICLVGVGLCSWTLSQISSTSTGSSNLGIGAALDVATRVGRTMAGLEFFASAIWVSCSLILAQEYSTQPLLFARGITLLSLSSTVGQLSAKLLGSALVSYGMDWRTVAKLGAGSALLGAILLQTTVGGGSSTSSSSLSTSRRHHASMKTTVLLSGGAGGKIAKPPSPPILETVKAVVGQKVFWLVGLAHISGYLARTCDKMLGPFIKEVTALPHQLCGGLTAFITLGFVHGCMRAQRFYKLPTVQDKNRMLQRGYLRSALSLVGLALCSSQVVRQQMTSSPYLMATGIAMLSAYFASSVSFQYFQIPNLVSSTVFRDHKAVCLSFLDGIAFFLTAPIWAMSSRMVRDYGWTAAWSFLTLLFGVGGTLMISALQPVLRQHHAQES